MWMSSKKDEKKIWRWWLRWVGRRWLADFADYSSGQLSHDTASFPNWYIPICKGRAANVITKSKWDICRISCPWKEDRVKSESWPSKPEPSSSHVNWRSLIVSKGPSGNFGVLRSMSGTDIRSAKQGVFRLTQCGVVVGLGSDPGGYSIIPAPIQALYR